MTNFFVSSRSLFLTIRQQYKLLLVCFVLALVAMMPLSFNLLSLQDGFSEETIRFISKDLLSYLISNFRLAILVCIGASFFGVLSAFFVYRCSSGKKQRLWDTLCLLPLAFPTYVMGFLYLSAFSPSSFMHTWFTQMGFGERGFLGSPYLLYLSMSLVLSPYIFLNVKISLEEIPSSIIEASKSFQVSRFMRFRKLYLPAILPAWRNACLLVAMECFAEFGAVSIFNYEALSVAIYRAWFGYFSLESAREISSILLLVVALFLLLIKVLVFKRLYKQGSSQYRFLSVPSVYRWGLSSALFLYLALALVFPLAYLVFLSLQATGNWEPLIGSIKNSFFLAGLVACGVVPCALFYVFLARFNRSLFSTAIQALMKLSYALPGTLLAVGCFYPLSQWDHYMSALSLGEGIFIGSIIPCVLALAIKYFSVAFVPIWSSFQSISRDLEEAALSLEPRLIRIVRKLHMPLLMGSLVPAVVLLTIDVIKEMPIQLMTRSYGWDGISVKIYEYTSEGEWELAAMASLVLVFFGSLPILLWRKRYGN